jgi:uncharacterized protein (TIGR02118 family)
LVYKNYAGGKTVIKTIVVAHRKAGITRAEFSKYWLEKHAPIAVRLMPGVRKYVQNHLVEIPGMEFQGDGVVETWYDNIDAWRKSMEAIRASKELAEDAANFCELRPGGGMWIVEEHIIKQDFK